MKILFVHKQILFPRDTGGKIRVLNLLKHLAKWHEVTYVSNLRPGEEKHLEEMRKLGLRMEPIVGESSRRGGTKFYVEAIGNIFSSKPFTIARNFDPAVRARVGELLSSESFDLVICDTVVMAPHTIGHTDVASVLFQHNVEAQILRRHATIASRIPKRLYMRDQWRKMSRFEADCGGKFDAVIAVSELDKKLFEEDYGWSHVRAIDTAVDTEFFQDESRGVQNRVTFLGSMDWMPNQDGVKWFVENVWNRIRTVRPEAEFHVIGRNPPADIVRLSSRPGVIIQGGVDDVRPYLAETTAFVVPLLVGGGTRLKIFEAMASGCAVVSTNIGAEGLSVVPGEHFLAADEPQLFADAVVKLLSDQRFRDGIRNAAKRLVRERFGCEPIARQFESICLDTVARKRRALEHSAK